MHQSKKIQKNLLATCDFFVGYKSTEGRYPFGLFFSNDRSDSIPRTKEENENTLLLTL
ncbi:hypothetical protein FTV88_3192 [Heliorestis convoluta]|uniref:Uncharacterized protein n=1 Tax=Heliorestis convoluta TaxID=356322 RepID=A0A5Q2N5D2_9FIRM|nr:hypothetical protein FTV88_2435 [Heliorestis convoluta]QGG49258.1 hypothetical protein FTV88_3192 [Heliorestis convoluta]